MTASIILVTALLVFSKQVIEQSETGSRPSITLATQFNIPAERAFTDWSLLDPAIRFILNDAQVWILMILVAAAVYWVFDWADEKLYLLYARTPATPVVAET
jgi:hypothetical protein